MAEAVSFVSSIMLHNRSSLRLKEFTRTVIKRTEVVSGRRERFKKQFYLSRNLPIPPVLDSGLQRDESEVILEEGEVEKQSCCTRGPIQWGYKNVYATSIAFMLVFSAFVGLQNLQSSLNQTLGTTSLALIYVFFLLVGFVTPGMVRIMKTKYSLLFGFLCHLVYILTNFYPEFYTLVPSSVLLGIGSGPVWAGVSTHLASVAVIISPFVVMESFDALISKFTGLFFFIFQLTQILGNLVSSLVLFPYSGGSMESGNSSLAEEVDPAMMTDALESDVCDNTEAMAVSSFQRYLLLSIYIGFDLLGIAILLLVVDKLPEEVMMNKMQGKFKVYCMQPFVGLFRLLFSRNMLLLGPLSLYNGLELSFAYSSFTQNIISDCVGVSKVGFTLIVLGFFSATMSIVYGKAVKYIHRIIMGSLAAFVNLFLLLFLQFYPLRPSYPLIFLFAIFWGTADGIWNTLTASLVGVLFPDNQEAGFSAFRIWMSLGFAIGFVITQVKILSHRLWVMIAVLVVSYVLYSVLELCLAVSNRRHKQQLKSTLE